MFDNDNTTQPEDDSVDEMDQAVQAAVDMTPETQVGEGQDADVVAAARDMAEEGIELVEDDADELV